MQIIINETNELSALDITVLRALVGNQVVTDAPAPAAAAPKEEEAPAEAPKARRTRKAATPKPEPVVEEPENGPEDDEEPAEEEKGQPEVDEAEEDLLGGDEPTMADAVALATELVSDGKAAKVKAALAEVGAKRVSELKGDGIATFVNSLR